MKNHFQIILAIAVSVFIISCSKTKTPEEVVADFTLFLSTGRCDEALELCSGDARMVVLGSIDSGCYPYETRVDSVTCEIKKDSAECLCHEYRADYGTMAFPYTLIKENNQWKIITNVKDLGGMEETQ